MDAHAKGNAIIKQLESIAIEINKVVKDFFKDRTKVLKVIRKLDTNTQYRKHWQKIGK